MMKTTLPKVPKLEAAVDRPYPTPLIALHLEYLACLGRVQRRSTEYIILPERVPDVVFRSRNGQYIVDASHPLRKVMRESPTPVTARQLSVLEALGAIKKTPEDVVIDFGSPKGTPWEQCHRLIDRLNKELPRGSILLAELSGVHDPLSLMAVEVFVARCSKAKLVHTVADDRIYLVGRAAALMIVPTSLMIVPQEGRRDDHEGRRGEGAKKGKVAPVSIPDNVSKYGLAASYTEGVVVRAMGAIYTWRCSRMNDLVTVNNEAAERGSAAADRAWLDLLIDSTFEDQSARWASAVGWPVAVG